MQGTTTLYSLHENSECGVTNVRTTADCNQLFRFCACPGWKINFWYAGFEALVMVFKVSIMLLTLILVLLFFAGSMMASNSANCVNKDLASQALHGC